MLILRAVAFFQHPIEAGPLITAIRAADASILIDPNHLPAGARRNCL
jgi:hypothetical protein